MFDFLNQINAICGSEYVLATSRGYYDPGAEFLSFGYPPKCTLGLRYVESPYNTYVYTHLGSAQPESSQTTTFRDRQSKSRSMKHVDFACNFVHRNHALVFRLPCFQRPYLQLLLRAETQPDSDLISSSRISLASALKVVFKISP
jgi:hypothetical protein